MSWLCACMRYKPHSSFGQAWHHPSLISTRSVTSAEGFRPSFFGAFSLQVGTVDRRRSERGYEKLAHKRLPILTEQQHQKWFQWAPWWWQLGGCGWTSVSACQSFRLQKEVVEKSGGKQGRESGSSPGSLVHVEREISSLPQQPSSHIGHLSGGTLVTLHSHFFGRENCQRWHACAHPHTSHLWKHFHCPKTY